MRYCLYLICGAILICLATTTPATAAVMLAGGHLPVCSSMAPAQCSGSTDWTEQALDEHRFRIDTEALRRWTEAVDQSADQSMARDWLQLLVHLRDDDGRWQTRAELAALIRSTRLSFPDQADREDILGEALYQTADHQQWMRLLDHFQQPVGDRREQVKLAHSRNSASVEVFERFVAMAAALSERPRPLIAVSTASSRDPYDALDFYLQVFEQAGAEVIWLPLDAAVHRARELGQCEQLAEFQASELGSHDRQRVWPRQYEQQVRFCSESEAGIKLVDKIDGLFLNGGDQWLTLHAFRAADGAPTPELERVLLRLESGKLALGGTSAGAAVQSGAAMISNGGNQAALLYGAKASPPPPPGCQRSGRCPQGLDGDSLTYHLPGGLGSVPFAIVDTHFSERQRQIRLLRLLTDSQQRLGIGVDETTALIIKPLPGSSFRLEAIGASSAWVFERTHHDTAKLHRLTSGAKLTMDLAAAAPTFPENTAADPACRPFDWSKSFNELLASAGSKGHSRWCLEPGRNRRFALSLEQLSAPGAGVQGFVMRLEALEHEAH